MNGDVKSIRLNKLTLLVTLITHFVGARTPTTLTESFRGFTQSLLISARITRRQSHGRNISYPFQLFFTFVPTFGAILSELMTESVCTTSYIYRVYL